jgi:hypothetical protein
VDTTLGLGRSNPSFAHFVFVARLYLKTEVVMRLMRTIALALVAVAVSRVFKNRLGNHEVEDRTVPQGKTEPMNVSEL